MPPMLIRLAVRRKNCTASRMNDLQALKVSCASVMIDRRGSVNRIGTQARPSAKATGTRMMSRPTKTRTEPWRPVRRRTLPLIVLPQQIRSSSTICSPANTIHVTPATGHATWISQSGKSASSSVGSRRTDVNRCPPTRTPPPSPDTEPREIRTMASPRRDRSADIDLEMLRLPYADHGADHDRPDEQEARHLLGPDVGRMNGV